VNNLPTGEAEREPTAPSLGTALLRALISPRFGAFSVVFALSGYLSPWILEHIEIQLCLYPTLGGGFYLVSGRSGVTRQWFMRWALWIFDIRVQIGRTMQFNPRVGMSDYPMEFGRPVPTNASDPAHSASPEAK